MAVDHLEVSVEDQVFEFLHLPCARTVVGDESTQGIAVVEERADPARTAVASVGPVDTVEGLV